MLDMDLVSYRSINDVRHGSGFYSHNTRIFSIQQFNVPTTHVATNQSSQLEHPSYFSIPALMDDSNLQSLHLDTNSLHTPTRGRRRRREPNPSPPLSPTSSTPHQRPRTHTYASHFQNLFTLTIAPPPPFTALLTFVQ